MNELFDYYTNEFEFDGNLIKLVDDCENNAEKVFKYYENIAQVNQMKVLKAFKDKQISARHFNASTGYGYGDEGRDKLYDLCAEIFKAEASIASPMLMSGTHAISLTLFGLLNPGDRICFVTGKPYDTLIPAVCGDNSFLEKNILYSFIPLSDNKINIEAVQSELRSNLNKVCYLQRSTGYDIRRAFTTGELKEAILKIKEAEPRIIVVVDNCYGEFVETCEPLECGADLIVGSFIKNPGGGVAPTGGYIAGAKDLINKIASRFTASGVGLEIGSYAYGYRLFYQGLFMAPHTVLQALKSVILGASVFERLGFEAAPSFDDIRGDITQVIKFGSEEKLTCFIRAIQAISPVDGSAVPYAWDMPGYDDKVIMAAGTFVQGASLELTSDAPIREPYCAYLQGALTYEHAKIGILNAINELKKAKYI